MSKIEINNTHVPNRNPDYRTTSHNKNLQQLLSEGLSEAGSHSEIEARKLVHRHFKVNKLDHVFQDENLHINTELSLTIRFLNYVILYRDNNTLCVWDQS